MSAGGYFLGIDQGTQSTKAVLFDSLGSEVASALVPVDLICTPEGQITQDPGQIFDSVLEAIAAVIQISRIRGAEVSALAIDSQICSLVAVDETLQPVCPILSHLDPSSDWIRDQLLEESGIRILRQNGSMPYIASRLLWLRLEKPDSYNQAYRVMLVGAFCAAKLCGLSGEQAYADQTTLNVFGWGDLKTKRWDEDLAAALKVNSSLSPEIRKSSDVVGGVQSEVAIKCGLLSGTPVIAGVGDAIAGWMGLGADYPGLLVDTSGTANHMCICVEEFVPDLDKRILSYYPSVSDSLGYQIGFTAGTGKSHRWVLDLFQEEKLASGLTPDEGFQQLDGLAGEIEPGSGGVFFIPHFGGRVCPPEPGMRGGWLGLTWHHNKAHLYRSVLESIAYEYALYLGRVRELYPDLDIQKLYTVGGGSKSSLWTQIKANVLGLPVEVFPEAENLAARGSAMLAARAVGKGKDFLAVRFRQESRTIRPIDDHAARYAILQNRYFQMLEGISRIPREITDDPK